MAAEDPDDAVDDLVDVPCTILRIPVRYPVDGAEQRKGEQAGVSPRHCCRSSWEWRAAWPSTELAQRQYVIDKGRSQWQGCIYELVANREMIEALISL